MGYWLYSFMIRIFFIEFLYMLCMSPFQNLYVHIMWKYYHYTDFFLVATISYMYRWVQNVLQVSYDSKRTYVLNGSFHISLSNIFGR